MKHLVSPRKQPVQSRSRMTVTALLDATAHILSRKGYARMTTNAIAIRAGVSIGSLYQYYPNKEALIMALYQRYYDKMEASIIKTINASIELSSFESIQRLVEAIIQAHLVEPYLHLQFEEMKNAGILPGFFHEQGLVRMSQLLMGILSEQQQTFRIIDVPVSACILLNTVHALVHSALKVPTSSDKLAVLIHEITRMIYGYLYIVPLDA